MSRVRELKKKEKGLGSVNLKKQHFCKYFRDFYSRFGLRQFFKQYIGLCKGQILQVLIFQIPGHFLVNTWILNTEYFFFLNTLVEWILWTIYCESENPRYTGSEYFQMILRICEYKNILNMSYNYLLRFYLSYACSPIYVIQSAINNIPHIFIEKAML